MNTQSTPSARFGRHTAAAAAAVLMALFGIVPVGTAADPKNVSEADVSLSDVNLSIPQGMRLARDRLHAMAERICAGGGGGRGGREPSSQAAFGACVDSTVADALQHIDSLRHTTRVLNTVTLGAGVRLADLDLSTPEGAGIAHQRLDATVRRLCSELARLRGLSYPQNYTACVHDTLARALARVDALAAARNTPTARRSAP